MSCSKSESCVASRGKYRMPSGKPETTAFVSRAGGTAWRRVAVAHDCARRAARTENATSARSRLPGSHAVQPIRIAVRWIVQKAPSVPTA